MAKYRIIKASNKITNFYGKELNWYRLEEKKFLLGWDLIASGYFETDYEAKQSLKPDKIIFEF